MPLLGNPGHDIHELAHSPRHKKRVAKYGKKKAHQMEVAAAMSARDRKRSGAKKGSRMKATRKRKRGAKRTARR